MYRLCIYAKVGMDAHQRSTSLRKAFDDALASPLSVLVLDNLERILGFGSTGHNSSYEVLQMLHLLLRRVPPEGRRLLVLATTSSPDVVQVRSSPPGLRPCENLRVMFCYC